MSAACRTLVALLVATPGAAIIHGKSSALDLDVDVKNDLQDLEGEDAPTPVEPGCECMSYRDVYERHGVRCGDLFEKHGLQCAMFYRKMEDTMCWNIPDDMDHRQWCYVSSECQHLNGGATLPARQREVALQWKTCERNKDRMSRYRTVKSLSRYAKKHDFDLSEVLSMAYAPMFGHTWEQLQQYLWNGTSTTFDLHRLPEPWKSKFQDLMHYGPTVFIPSANGKPPQAILERSKMYVTSEPVVLKYKQIEEKLVHPFQMTELTVLQASEY